MGEPIKKLTTVGNNGQISIGKEFAGREILIEKFPDGHIMISPGTFIPDSQKTFFTSEADEKLAKFDKWEKEHPPSEKSENNLRTKLKARKRG